jgi:hypothetical protein
VGKDWEWREHSITDFWAGITGEINRYGTTEIEMTGIGK